MINVATHLAVSEGGQRQSYAGPVAGLLKPDIADPAPQVGGVSTGRGLSNLGSAVEHRFAPVGNGAIAAHTVNPRAVFGAQQCLATDEASCMIW